jgi:hypothetical protein
MDKEYRVYDLDGTAEDFADAATAQEAAEMVAYFWAVCDPDWKGSDTIVVVGEDGEEFRLHIPTYEFSCYR